MPGSPPKREQDPALAEALEGADVAFAYLFGSRAQSRERPGSDADIAVMPTRKLDLLGQGRLADRLAAGLGVPDIDLILLDQASLELRGHVVQDGRLLFSADEPARVAFETHTRSEYFDFQPMLREHTRRYLDRVAERGLG